MVDRRDVKCSSNWMWAAKLPGEGAHMYDAMHGMTGAMAALGIAVDGGKDSLSMAATAVRAPAPLCLPLSSLVNLSLPSPSSR